MELANRHIVVTGGAGGIGRALVRRFAAEGAGAIVVADRDLAGAQAVAAEVGALAVELDAGDEASVRALIAQASEANGAIDIFISNAGVPGAMRRTGGRRAGLGGGLARQRDGARMGLRARCCRRCASAARAT